MVSLHLEGTGESNLNLDKQASVPEVINLPRNIGPASVLICLRKFDSFISGSRHTSLVYFYIKTAGGALHQGLSWEKHFRQT